MSVQSTSATSEAMSLEPDRIHLLSEAMDRVQRQLLKGSPRDLFRLLVKIGEELFSAENCSLFLIDDDIHRRLLSDDPHPPSHTKPPSPRHLILIEETTSGPRPAAIPIPDHTNPRDSSDHPVGMTAHCAALGELGHVIALSGDELRRHPAVAGTDTHTFLSGGVCHSLLGRYAWDGAARDQHYVRRLAVQRAGARQAERLTRRLLARAEHLLARPEYWRAVELIAAALLRRKAISGRAARHLFDRECKAC